MLRELHLNPFNPSSVGYVCTTCNLNMFGLINTIPHVDCDPNTIGYMPPLCGYSTFADLRLDGKGPLLDTSNSPAHIPLPEVDIAKQREFVLSTSRRGGRKTTRDRRVGISSMSVFYKILIFIDFYLITLE